MINKSDKIIFIVLIVLLIGVNSAFISAVNIDNSLNKNQLKLKPITDDEIEEINDIESEVNLEDDEKDVPIIGDAFEMAKTVALDYLGEGKVTDSEIGDEEGYYEIEVTLKNGEEVDVHLDEYFNVISVEYD